MSDAHPLAAVADALDAHRSRILEDWRKRVHSDPSLEQTLEWNRKQLNDHFPDVLEAYSRILRAWPEPSEAATDDQLRLAHAHARTRWLQGYSLRGVIREWGHFNTAVMDAVASLACTAMQPHAATGAEPLHLWSLLVNDQLTESALEYHNLMQAEAETRAQELSAVLEGLRSLAHGRALMFGSVAESLRADLSVVMTSASMLASTGTGADVAELQSMSRARVAALDRALSDMVLLARLEAGLVQREIVCFDAAEGLMLLASGLHHQAERANSELAWDGPEPFPVEGDERNVRLLAQHLLLSGLQSDAPGPMELRWAEDARNDARWLLLVLQRRRPAGASASPAVARELAVATDSAQQANGVPPTGYEAPLQDGRIPVASRDGVNLLIAKHLCELLDASLELEAEEGLIRYRVSLPRTYDRSP